MKILHMVLGPVATNCYIAADDAGNAAIVDPADKAEKIIGELRRNNLTPRAILLTHGHFDHVGAVKGLKEQYPEIPVMIGAADAHRLGEIELEAPMWGSYINAANYKGISADRVLSDGDTVDVGDMHFTVLSTPGHTEGGVTYVCGDCLFTGDTLFCGEVGRTDLAGGNYDTLLASLRKLAALPGDYTVLPGHDRESTLERERKTNYYIREALSCDC